MSVVKEFWKETKNTVLQVPEIERKVKEATSNEKWGASSTLMTEIAHHTFNYQDLALIMDTLWRRLNDDGKNWRHVYKGLLLTDYLLRNGSDQFVREIRSRIHIITSLESFQHRDDNNDDVGLHVREKAKKVAELVSDSETLKRERDIAKKNAKRYKTNISSESYGVSRDYSYDSYDSKPSREREKKRSPSPPRRRNSDKIPPVKEITAEELFNEPPQRESTKSSNSGGSFNPWGSDDPFSPSKNTPSSGNDQGWAFQGNTRNTETFGLEGNTRNTAFQGNTGNIAFQGNTGNNFNISQDIWRNTGGNNKPIDPFGIATSTTSAVNQTATANWGNTSSNNLNLPENKLSGKEKDLFGDIFGIATSKPSSSSSSNNSNQKKAMGQMGQGMGPPNTVGNTGGFGGNTGGFGGNTGGFGGNTGGFGGTTGGFGGTTGGFVGNTGGFRGNTGGFGGNTGGFGGNTGGFGGTTGGFGGNTGGFGGNTGGFGGTTGGFGGNTGGFGGNTGGFGGNTGGFGGNTGGFGGTTGGFRGTTNNRGNNFW